MRVGIRTQVLIALAAVLVFGLAASYFITVGIARSALMEQRAESLRHLVKLSALHLEASLTPEMEAPDTLGSIALPAAVGLVALMDSSGDSLDGLGGDTLVETVGLSVVERACATTGTAFRHETRGGHLYLVVASPVGPLDDAEDTTTLRLVVAQRLTGLMEEIGHIERLYALFAGFILVLAILIGYFLLGRAVLKPVQRLTRRVERIGDGALSTGRIIDPPHGELGDLMRAFEQLVIRLEDDAAHIQRQLSELQLANREIAAQQEQLVRTGKLASVGELAAGVAHEIGNPIAVLQGYIEMLSDRDLSAEQRESYRLIMEESVDRVGTIIRDLLDFARPGTDTVSSGDIIAAVHSVVKLIEPQKRMRHVSLRVQTTLAAAPVGMPSNRIEQILINLLFNAADATPASGHVDLNVEAIDQGYAFTVSDEGSGISPDVLERIFDPFYTTKDPGEGTGLGLSICHGLVERYAGTIHVQSEPGAGTCFTIRLPAVQSEIS